MLEQISSGIYIYICVVVLADGGLWLDSKNRKERVHAQPQPSPYVGELELAFASKAFSGLLEPLSAYSYIQKVISICIWPSVSFLAQAMRHAPRNAGTRPAEGADMPAGAD